MNQREHRLFWLYTDMRRRCELPRNKSYKWYGARGIRVCKRWEKFSNFLEDMWPSYKEGLTLDRIDNSKGYSKSNCRWATRQEQVMNRRIFKECLNGHPWTEASTKWTHNGVNRTRRCRICLDLYLNKKRAAK